MNPEDDFELQVAKIIKPALKEAKRKAKEEEQARKEAERRVASDPSVGFSLKKLWKKAKKGVRKAVKGKVWRVAEKALSKAGNFTPAPFGPAMKSAAAAMKVTRGLVKAKRLARSPRKRDRARAAAIVRAAKRKAMRHPVRRQRAAAAKALMSAPKLYLTLSPGA